jgi:predicted DNA-binding transcriptional regulator AlpA
MNTVQKTATVSAGEALPSLENITQLCARLGGLTRGRIYALMRQPGSTFPRPLKIGKTSRWRKADVDAWIHAQAVAQGLEVAA